MSLELKIETLTAAVDRLTQIFHLHQGAAPVAAPMAAPVAAPVAPVAPVAAPVAPPVMPPLPVFTVPAPVAPPLVPFSDTKGLIDYVMVTYKAIGPDKGAGIQNVLVTLGVANINDVKPEMYEYFYRAVEALKV